jgi:hypothetical protein
MSNPPTPLPNIPPDQDPLHVLRSTKPVVERAALVRIDHAAVASVAADMLDEPVPPPEWDATLHYRDGTWQTAGWVFALDTLNFCFWGQDPADPERRWRVEIDGTIHQGYWALAAALTRAVHQGFPLWNAAYLAEIPEADVRAILRPAARSDATEIPLFSQRLANLREFGRNLIARFDAGLEPPVVNLIRAAEGSAARLVQLIVATFPSFDDVATYSGLTEPVRFYKRAQILVADLHGAFAGQDLGRFDDLATLTAFADYKVPQVLRALGILAYDQRLTDRLARREAIPPGSPAEVEIRATTVWACELLRQALATHGRDLRAFEIDWLLWSAGQHLPADVQPYHRTPTIFY